MGGDEFLAKCEEGRKMASSFSNPLIVHHHDADGICSAAITVSALRKLGKSIRTKCIKKLDDAAIEKLQKEPEIIFTDLGGGNPRVNELRDVLIIDHHQTEGIEKFQINPMLFGIDGGDELSASGAAFCVFGEHAELGAVGAVGDMQSPLRGMNRFVLDSGVSRGEIIIENDLRFYGRYSRPLLQFLVYSDDPYIPMISYREDRALSLLSELGIPLVDGESRRVYADLNSEEKKKLISAIAKIMVNSDFLKKANELLGESYIFPNRPKNETYEANEFSTLLNACGRHGKSEIGLKICLEDEGAYNEGRALLQYHRKMIKLGIEFALSKVQDLGVFYLLDGRGIVDEGIIGIVCGMVLQQSWTKPIIGLSLGENDTIKVSGRASRNLIDSGLNLGQLMKQAAAKAGGIGGGHRIAAGASIPRDSLNDFLRASGEYFG